MAESKWRHFERLVAAIHQAADRGAEVCWNDTINGRQFDVTIRFRKGLYDHLTVVECKNYGNPVPIEKVEAFITKSTDVHANVSVLASTSGFQSGAKDCALRHNITLLHVTTSEEIDPTVFGAEWGDPVDALHSIFRTETRAIATDAVAGIRQHGGGAVLLLHTWPGGTVDALPLVLEDLHEGTRFVTVDALEEVP